MSLAYFLVHIPMYTSTRYMYVVYFERKRSQLISEEKGKGKNKREIMAPGLTLRHRPVYISAEISSIASGHRRSFQYARKINLVLRSL